MGGVVGGPCDFSVSPSPFGLDFGALDFGTSDLGLTIEVDHSVAYMDKNWLLRGQAFRGIINID